MRKIIKEKSFDKDVKEAFLDFVQEDGLNFKDASSMVAQIYNIAFDEVVDMLNGMGIREDSDTKKVVIDEADDKKDDKKDDKDKDDKDKKDSDKKDDDDPDKKDDKKKEATAANTDKADDREKEKAKQKADDKKKDNDRKADAKDDAKDDKDSKKDEEIITVEEDTPIPGTDIILEKGDKIILVSEKKKLIKESHYDEQAFDSYNKKYRIYFNSYQDEVELIHNQNVIATFDMTKPIDL